MSLCPSRSWESTIADETDYIYTCVFLFFFFVVFVFCFPFCFNLRLDIYIYMLRKGRRVGRDGGRSDGEEWF